MSILACVPPSSFIRNSPPIMQSPSAQFVLAKVNGNIFLAYMQPSTQGTTASALSVIEATIFIHEFINIFRFSHHAIIHPSTVHVVYPIDEQCIRYEEDNGTVFLSKDVMERLRKLTHIER